MKLLLVGPFPPPHGGISVHISTLDDLLRMSGIPCRVLNISRGAAASDRYMSIRGHFHFLRLLVRYARKGWSLHIHINGHNWKSWMVALSGGLMGTVGPGAILTIHSGLTPAYLDGSLFGRFLAWASSKFYRHLIAVSSPIKDALCSVSVPQSKIEILPAFFSASGQNVELPAAFENWAYNHQPILSTALFFRPEYGFALLAQAVEELRKGHPRLGCVVMGDSNSRPEGLGEHLLALGDVSHDVCLGVIARSDIFVRPTLSDGDAVSVREALALGTPVVASDVVCRPSGTLCFKTGDAGDLALKIEAQMRAQTGPMAEWQPDSDGLQRLLELYGV